jgi:4-hydroxyphenylpyruvate dioxygenase-like putative hemolysin
MQMKGIYCKYLLSQFKIDLVFEIIQRMGAKGFGAGIQGTFESIERTELRERYKAAFFCIM